MNNEYVRKDTPPSRIIPEASIFINGLAESQTNLKDEKCQYFTNDRANIKVRLDFNITLSCREEFCLLRSQNFRKSRRCQKKNQSILA